MSKRIVQMDNYGMAGEMPGRDDKFILWPMRNAAATAIAKILNDETPEDGPYYYEVVDEAYEPRVFIP